MVTANQIKMAAAAAAAACNTWCRLVSNRLLTGANTADYS